MEKNFQIKSNCIPKNVLKCHIYASFKHLQGKRFHHFPGHPVSLPDDPCSEEYFFLISKLNLPCCNLSYVSYEKRPIPKSQQPFFRKRYPRMTVVTFLYNLKYSFGKDFKTLGEVQMLLCEGVLSHCQHLIMLSSFMCLWKKLQCCGTCVRGRIS